MNLLKKTTFFFLILTLAGCKSDRKHHPTVFNDSFYELEGQGSKLWKAKITAKDHELLAHLAPIYEKAKQLQYNEQKTYKIPKILHFIWLGPKNFPAMSIKYIRSWIAHHPDWKVIFWTDRKRIAPCSELEVRSIENFSWTKLKHYFDSTLNWAEKSDYLRYEILAQEGGIYVDHDVLCLKNMDQLAQNYNFFCGLELPHHLIQGYAITPCNALIGASPHHPIMTEVLAAVENAWQSHHVPFDKKRLSEFELVMNHSYMPFTYGILSKIQIAEGQNIVFPAAYFYSRRPLPSLYAKHQFATTWALTKTEKLHVKMIDRIKKLVKGHRQLNKWVKSLLLINGFLMLLQLIYIYKKRRAAR